ncbi:hypothetical protein PVAP13_3KG264317 [Panicum virgatum]|uniref:Uncharacterized protein n=1 Tax=Panicum virgatum TaxID=38727 RepID=A0A8T0V730_PANVG|nr:hypothetical protein PVAP13_3KG264317 [Panicum virgatum]
MGTQGTQYYYSAPGHPVLRQPTRAAEYGRTPGRFFRVTWHPPVFFFWKPPSPVREKPLQPGHIAVEEEPPEREPRPVKPGHRRIEQAGGALRCCAFIDHDTAPSALPLSPAHVGHRESATQPVRAPPASSTRVTRAGGCLPHEKLAAWAVSSSTRGG